MLLGVKEFHVIANGVPVVLFTTDTPKGYEFGAIEFKDTQYNCPDDVLVERITKEYNIKDYSKFPFLLKDFGCYVRCYHRYPLILCLTWDNIGNTPKDVAMPVIESFKKHFNMLQLEPNNEIESIIDHWITSDPITTQIKGDGAIEFVIWINNMKYSREINQCRDVVFSF